LASEYAATVCTGYEADDFLGIEQSKHQTKSIICSIDKDLLQVPGHHWNFVKEVHRFVSPFEALRNLYSQGILGDSSDNIPGFDGKLRQKAPIFVQKLIDPLYEMHEEGEMYQYVLSLYSGDVETFHRNMNLLYILREEGVHWQPPNRRLTDGQMEDSIRSSSEFLEAECDAGPPSMQP
jgi:hypothetical protein